MSSEHKQNLNKKRKLVLDTMKVFIDILNPQVLQTVLHDSLTQCRHKKTITSQELSNLFEGTEPAKLQIHEKIKEEFFK